MRVSAPRRCAALFGPTAPPCVSLESRTTCHRAKPFRSIPRTSRAAMPSTRTSAKRLSALPRARGLPSPAIARRASPAPGGRSTAVSSSLARFAAGHGPHRSNFAKRCASSPACRGFEPLVAGAALGTEAAVSSALSGAFPAPRSANRASAASTLRLSGALLRASSASRWRAASSRARSRSRRSRSWRSRTSRSRSRRSRSSRSRRSRSSRSRRSRFWSSRSPCSRSRRSASSRSRSSRSRSLATARARSSAA